MNGDSYRNRNARNVVLAVGGVMAVVSGADIAWHGIGAFNGLFLLWGLLLWVPAALFPPELFARSLQWLERILEPIRNLGPW